MPLSLPFPNQPVNGASLDATPVQSNFNAIAQAIQSFDASQIQAGTVAEAALATAINPRLRASEQVAPFVVSGLIWSTSGTLTTSMSGGTAYVNGFRVLVNSVGSHVFTLNSDTYVDLDQNGTLFYTTVSNNGVSPALAAANALRIAIVISGASAISSVNQGQLGAVAPVNAAATPYLVSDTLGNLIYPRTPTPTLIGFLRGVDSDTTSAPSAPRIAHPAYGAVAAHTTVLIPAGRKAQVVTYAFNHFPSSAGAEWNTTVWDGGVGAGNMVGFLDSSLPSTAGASSVGRSLFAQNFSAAMDNSAGSSASTKTITPAFSSNGGGTTYSFVGNTSASIIANYLAVELV
jgi:hypothetical protein